MICDSYDHLFDALDKVERYQDIRVDKKTIVPGMRDCDSRYNYIKSIVNSPNRQFSILDIGANFGYYTIRFLEDFPNAHAVLIQPYDEAEVLHRVIELNHDINHRAIVLNIECTKENMSFLSQTEHFDLILCLNILHHFNDPLDIYDSIKQMAGQLIIETPPVGDVNACGQDHLAVIFDKVNHEFDQKSSKGFERHTLSSTFSHIYSHEFNPIISKHMPSFCVPKTNDAPRNGGQSVTDGGHEKGQFYGLHLTTYHSLNGIHPIPGKS